MIDIALFVFVVMVILNVWAIIGFIAIGLSGREYDNLVEAIIGCLFFPFVLAGVFCDWMEKKLNKY